MIEELVEAILHGAVEVVCYWAGKLVLMPMGIGCSADDQWGMRRKKRGKEKPPWTWVRTERRYLRSDVVQLIGLAVLALTITAIVLLALNFNSSAGA